MHCKHGNFQTGITSQKSFPASRIISWDPVNWEWLQYNISVRDNNISPYLALIWQPRFDKDSQNFKKSQQLLGNSLCLSSSSLNKKWFSYFIYMKDKNVTELWKVNKHFKQKVHAILCSPVWWRCGSMKPRVYQNCDSQSFCKQNWTSTPISPCGLSHQPWNYLIRV